MKWKMSGIGSPGYTHNTILTSPLASFTVLVAVVVTRPFSPSNHSPQPEEDGKMEKGFNRQGAEPTKDFRAAAA